MTLRHMTHCITRSACVVGGGVVEHWRPVFSCLKLSVGGTTWLLTSGVRVSSVLRTDVERRPLGVTELVCSHCVPHHCGACGGEKKSVL